MALLPSDGVIAANGDFDLVAPGVLNDITVTGDFAGGTLEVQKVNPLDAPNAATASGGSFTKDFTIVTENSAKSIIRLKLSGAGSPSRIASVQKVSK